MIDAENARPLRRTLADGTNLEQGESKRCGDLFHGVDFRLNQPQELKPSTLSGSISAAEAVSFPNLTQVEVLEVIATILEFIQKLAQQLGSFLGLLPR